MVPRLKRAWYAVLQALCMSAYMIVMKRKTTRLHQESRVSCCLCLVNPMSCRYCWALQAAKQEISEQLIIGAVRSHPPLMRIKAMMLQSNHLLGPVESNTAQAEANALVKLCTVSCKLAASDSAILQACCAASSWLACCGATSCWEGEGAAPVSVLAVEARNWFNSLHFSCFTSVSVTKQALAQLQHAQPCFCRICAHHAADGSMFCIILHKSR